MTTIEPPVRVLHVVSAMDRGGAETLLMNVYRNLDRSRLQFDFIVHREEPGDYDEEIEALGGKIFRVPSLRQAGPAAYVRALREVMSAASYAAVHAHTDYQCGFPALAARLAGIPRRICHSHSAGWPLGNSAKARMMLRALQGLMRMSATHYCSCSMEAGRFLFGARTGKKPVCVLKNGIEPRLFAVPDSRSRQKEIIGVREELNVSADTKLLGHVGTFSESKNQIFILQILKALLERGENAAAVFAGDGPLKHQVEREADRLNLGPRVRFLGVRDDVPRLLRAFDVFVFPSLFEGFGIAAVEAQCAGTPCVAADTVPRSTDMGLGLITYVRLDDGVPAWTEAVMHAFAKPPPDAESVIRQIRRSGFDIASTIPEWLSLYGIRHDSMVQA